MQKHANAVAFWHRLHLLEFNVQRALQSHLLKGAKRLNISTSKGRKREKRRAVAISDLRAMVRLLEAEAAADPAQRPRTIAVKAALLFAFFAMCRIKDVTVARQRDSAKKSVAQRSRSSRPSLLAFDPEYDASGASITLSQPQNGRPGLVTLRLPFDKVTGEEGAQLCCAEQRKLGEVDPYAAVSEHVATNAPTASEPAFSFTGKDGSSRLKLTRSFLRQKVASMASELGLPDIKLHGFRIGGFNFYKLEGVDMDTIRQHGRWRGNATDYYQRDKVRSVRKKTANLGRLSDDDYTASSDSSSYTASDDSSSD